MLACALLLGAAGVVGVGGGGIQYLPSISQVATGPQVDLGHAGAAAGAAGGPDGSVALSSSPAAGEPTTIGRPEGDREGRRGSSSGGGGSSSDGGGGGGDVGASGAASPGGGEGGSSASGGSDGGGSAGGGGGGQAGGGVLGRTVGGVRDSTGGAVGGVTDELKRRTKELTDSVLPRNADGLRLPGTDR
jgi:hypothetical protein